MSLQFIGERLPELKGLAPAERRVRFLHAVKGSYRSWQTWLGLILFLTMYGYAGKLSRILHESLAVVGVHGNNPDGLEPMIILLAFVVLWKCQESAIRKELRNA